jgi:hypothetical protein
MTREAPKTKPKPKKRRIIDWPAIEREYRTGIYSNAELARTYGVDRTAISKRASRHGWKRDLSARVRERTRQKIVTDDVTDVTGGNAKDEEEFTEEEIVEAAARTRVYLLRDHRKDISALRKAETELIKEIDGKPKKTWVGQFQGKVITKSFGIAATERASALQALAGVQHKRIALERQAFGIDEDGRRPDEARDIEVTFVTPDGNPYTQEDPE